MKKYIIVTPFVIAIAMSTLASGDERWPFKDETKIRKEYEEAKVVALSEPWNQDVLKWEMDEDLSPALVKNARAFLKDKGVNDCVNYGVISYRVGGGRKVLMVPSEKSAGRIAKYYCVGYEKLNDGSKGPDKVWVKYIERVMKYKDVDLSVKKSSKQLKLPDQEDGNIKVADWVPGKPSFVFNPYTHNIVDVRGKPLGSLVKDPEDPEQRVFRIPNKK